jgi:hypothetical protein
MHDTTARLEFRADEHASAGCMPEGRERPWLLIWGSVLVQISRNSLQVSDHDVAFARQLVTAAQDYLEATVRLRDRQEAQAWAEANGGERPCR